jgi:ferric-dicitrate binding protein FerR (iron transport regulator)
VTWGCAERQTLEERLSISSWLLKGNDFDIRARSRKELEIWDETAKQETRAKRRLDGWMDGFGQNRRSLKSGYPELPSP